MKINLLQERSTLISNLPEQMKRTLTAVNNSLNGKVCVCNCVHGQTCVINQNSSLKFRLSLKQVFSPFWLFIFAKRNRRT